MTEGRALKVLSHRVLACLFAALLGLQLVQLMALLGLPFVQRAEAESVFASDVLGEWLEGYDLRSAARGRTGIGTIDLYTVGGPNPAGPAFSDNTLGQVGVSLDVRRSTTGDGTAQRTSGRLVGISVFAPVRDGFGFRAQIHPATDGSFALEENLSADSGLLRIEGSRGLLFYGADVLYRGGSRLAFGAGVGILTGSLRDETSYTFADSGWSNASTRHDLRVEPAFTFSAGTLMRMTPQLSAGAFIASGATGDARSRYRAPSGTEWSENSDVKFPLGAGAGLGLQITSRWRMSGDLIWRNWEDAAPSSIAARPGGGYRNTLQWGLGIERQPRSTSRASTIRDRIALRAGFAWVPWYLLDAKGNGVDEWRASAGIGLGLPQDRGSVDLTAIFGRRGSQDTNGLQETFFRLGLGFTFARVLREY